MVKPLDREMLCRSKVACATRSWASAAATACGRGVKIGLLLGRIEPGQQVAGIDVGADIHQAREHASAHTKGEVGAEAGLDLAGQRYGSLSVPRLHKLGVHQRGALDRSGGAVIAGTQGRRQKRERECGTAWASE